MPLTPAESLQIGNFFTPLFGDDPNNLIGQLFPDTQLPPFAGGGLAAVTAWLRSLNDQQLLVVLTLATGNADAESAMARINTAPSNNGDDPFQAELLAGKKPFFNRSSLRAILKNLCGAGEKRILVIRGSKRVGKTTTKELIGHAAFSSTPGSFLMTHCDLADGPGGANAIVQSLATRIQFDAVPPADLDSTEQWYRKQLITWFLELIRQQVNGVCWIVIDSVQQFKKGWKDSFVNELAVQTIEKRTLTSPRLVLIDHNKSLPFDCRKYAVTHELSKIAMTDVREFLSGKMTDIDIESVISKADNIPDDSDWLETLQKLTMSVLKTEDA